MLIIVTSTLIILYRNIRFYNALVIMKLSLFQCWKGEGRAYWNWFFDKGITGHQQVLYSRLWVGSVCMDGKKHISWWKKKCKWSFRCIIFSFFVSIVEHLFWSFNNSWISVDRKTGVSQWHWSTKIPDNSCDWRIWNSDVQVQIWFLASDNQCNNVWRWSWQGSRLVLNKFCCNWPE